MKMKSLVLLAMAVGCGLVAMLGVQQVLSGDKKPQVETGKVLVAATNIMPGRPLDDSNVHFKEMSKDQIPEGAVTTREEFEDRSLRVSAVPHEVVMLAKLGGKGEHGGSIEIPEGMRVATVPVNVTKTHSGLILPGDRVDVVVTYSITIPGRGQVRKTKTILQYIEIFSTDNIRQSAVANGETKENSAKNISVIVTPDQYNILMLAESKGQLSLALRHRGDDSEVHPIDVDDTHFDQIEMTMGQDNHDGESSKDNKKHDPPATSIRELLDNEQTKSADASKSARPADGKVQPPAPKPLWTLKIYDGDKIREEHVELPEPDAPPQSEAGKAGGQWQQFLKNAFRSAS